MLLKAYVVSYFNPYGLKTANTKLQNDAVIALLCLHIPSAGKKIEL